MKMHRNRWITLTALLSIFSASLSLPALEVKLVAQNDASTQRAPGIATFGVPFAKGAVTDLAKMCVSAGATILPAQFKKLAPWDDGSVRWALVDCQVTIPAGGKTEITIRDDGKNKAPAQPVKAGSNATGAALSTGPLQLLIDKTNFNLFKTITVDGKQLISTAGKGLVLYTKDGKAVPAGPPESIVIEEPGPLRAVVCLRGKYPGVHNDLLRYTVRVTAYAGQKFLKIRAWLENSGQHGYTHESDKPPQSREWFAFDGMAIELGLGLGSTIKASCEGVEGTGKFKVYQYCKPAPHYSKPSHGYTNFEYTVTSGTNELKKDKITEGIVALSGDEGKLTVAIRHFWENYEKAIELDGTTLRLWLWPTEGQWPRVFSQHACPGYATGMIEPLRIKDAYNIPGSVHKGAEMILDFSGRAPLESGVEVSQPLFPVASAEYYASTDAAPVLFTPPDVRSDDAECNLKLSAWMNMTRSAADPKHASSFWAARKNRVAQGNAFSWGYWYGWMDFGDLAMPHCSYTHLHYDWPLVMLVNALRTGDLNYLRLGTDMIRHRTEVDQQWSDRALETCRGFQRHGETWTQFHCGRFTRSHPSVTTTDLVGPILYYMMTGDPKTHETIQRSAPQFDPAWEKIFASTDYGTRQIPGRMGPVCQTILTYLAMYDLTADKKWHELAMKMFDKCVVAKWKGLGPHLHSPNQIQSQDYTADDMNYCYSIQTLCQLHHRTRNEKVFELLQAGCDTEFPENFFDAPLFLASLNAYVALNAKEGADTYIANAKEFWISGFPESKCPPVFLPNNSVWSRQKAMWMRTGHLLQYYYWKKKASK